MPASRSLGSKTLLLGWDRVEIQLFAIVHSLRKVEKTGPQDLSKNHVFGTKNWNLGH